MRNIFIVIIVAVTIAGLSACGGTKKADAPAAEVAEQENSLLNESMNVGNLKQASAAADSMSLFVDDLTPEQTVRVLMTFLSVHNDLVGKNYRRDLETLRKFVDVYDIALSANPKDTRAAFAKVRKMNPSIDFDSIAKTFREKLSQYDAVQDGSLVAAETVPADTVVADSVKAEEEIPLELRPAE
ncbi:MAG: hypothetical protein NC221_07355 [Duncaniella sp.]|nr:hypothetical protein [Muribaculum sp.]MCM1255918.1 hypothetical protein [Duncaniella sp.]